MKSQEKLIEQLSLTGIRIAKVNKNLHWIEIYFEHVDCKLMQKIGITVEEFFKTEGRYTHLLPKFIGKDGCVCLIFDNSILQS